MPALPTLPAPLVRIAIQALATRVISGHPVMIFKIPQVVNLTYPVNTAYEGVMRSNYPVNRTDFRLVRGVTNEIVFFVRDIDRKAVPLPTDNYLTITLVDQQTDMMLLQRRLITVDLAKGIYQFVTLPAEMDTWPTGTVRYSVSYTRADNTTVMLWTDQNYGPYSYAHITEGPFPGPATTVTLVPEDDFDAGADGMYSASLVGAAKDGYPNGMQTFVLFMDAFNGSVRIDGAIDLEPEDSDWFAATTLTYSAFTGKDVVNVTGNFIWLRIVVLNGATGVIERIQYKG